MTIGPPGTRPPSDDALFIDLIERLTSIQREAIETWNNVRTRLGNIHPSHAESARNLVHYLSLRRHDIRELQSELARVGMSSLGRSEAHVMSNLDRVLDLLRRLVDIPDGRPADDKRGLSLDEGAEILRQNTDVLLGSQPLQRRVRIMVTMPSEASTDYELVRDLVACGMDCARINCAHDSAVEWQAMVDNIRRATAETGRSCKICIDIAGPKLRTGQFRPGPRVLKWRPERDLFGRVIAPARIWITPQDRSTAPPVNTGVTFSLPKDFISEMTVGDRIKFKDARGRSRRLRVADIRPDGVWLEARKTAYVVPETELRIADRTGRHRSAVARAACVPPIEQHALLRTGDHFYLTREQDAGTPEIIGPSGGIIRAAVVSCTLPEIFDQVKIGERIWLDDGKLGGMITSIGDGRIRVEISNAGPKGHRLRGDKGINLPDSELDLPPLTDRDRENLKFIVENADLIGYSFVRSAKDLRTLQAALKELGGDHLGIILKIETRAAFENLPELLLALMENESAGVMIARGDLAVETGFERLAEIQEEILWMCEAGHMPVIWATQVLEQLSKKGIFSRAEITDAAMSERAECVMLNKGPFVLDAVRTLDDILRRMQPHQDKKRSMMRPLKLAQRFLKAIAA